MLDLHPQPACTMRVLYYTLCLTVDVFGQVSPSRKITSLHGLLRRIVCLTCTHIAVSHLSTSHLERVFFSDQTFSDDIARPSRETSCIINSTQNSGTCSMGPSRWLPFVNFPLLDKCTDYNSSHWSSTLPTCCDSTIFGSVNR